MAKKIVFPSEETLSELECLVDNSLIRIQITDIRNLDVEYVTLDKNTVGELIDHLKELHCQID